MKDFPMRAGFRTAFSLGLATACFFLTAGAGLRAEPDDGVFRLVFSSSMFTEVNESDVRAAMKVWIMTVAEERGLPVDPEPYLARNIDELTLACGSPRTGGCAVILPEYARLRREIAFSHHALSIAGGEYTEEYLLLARRDSGLERLDQLQGRRVAVLNNPRMSLALVWLDTLLLEAGHAPAANWFQSVVFNKSASQTALPVFFSQIETCLITRSAFETMVELNPQLQEQLRVIAASPPLVPALFVYTADSSNFFRTSMLEAMEQFRDNPAGLQILHLTQSENIEIRPPAVLEPSLELLDRHDRLLGAAGNGGNQ
ncbi:MAG: hypothetical protein EA399_16640 [Desulfovibrionales bacterium]|nr:MAG: hypothetical protein EA399_16640 [Desulfovibrionales bacterium]